MTTAAAPVRAGRIGPRLAVRLALVAALCAVSGLAFEGAFLRSDLVRPVVVGAVGAAVVSVLVTTVARQRLAVALAAQVVAAVPLGLLAGAGGPGSLLEGFLDGPYRILTATAPAAPEPELLAVPFLATLAASAISSEVVQRSRAAAAVLLAPLALTVLGLGVRCRWRRSRRAAGSRLGTAGGSVACSRPPHRCPRVGRHRESLRDPRSASPAAAGHPGRLGRGRRGGAAGSASTRQREARSVRAARGRRRAARARTAGQPAERGHRAPGERGPGGACSRRRRRRRSSATAWPCSISTTGASGPAPPSSCLREPSCLRPTVGRRPPVTK